MSDWKEIVGHDFAPEDWTETQREAERLVMGSRTLAEIRPMQEITLADLAAMLGMTQSTVAQLEARGDTRISTLRTAIEKMGGASHRGRNARTGTHAGFRVRVTAREQALQRLANTPATVTTASYSHSSRAYRFIIIC